MDKSLAAVLFKVSYKFAKCLCVHADVCGGRGEKQISKGVNVEFSGQGVLAAVSHSIFRPALHYI